MKHAQLTALQGIFAAHSIAIGLWFPRIPGVKEALSLDFSTLSFALLGLPVGVICGMLIASRVVQSLGIRKACMTAPPLFALLMILPALTTSLWQLIICLYFAGLALSVVEVAINAAANAYQDASGRRIMSRCHAFWSIGVMIGTLSGGALADAGVSFLGQQLVAEPIAAILSLLFAMRLTVDAIPEVPAQKTRFAMPGAGLLALAIMPIGALMIEGAFLDWSVLFVETTLGQTTFIGSSVLGTFAVSMALWRYLGDWITDSLGELRFLVISGGALAIGVALFGLSPGLPMAYLGAFIGGFGAANPYPIAMSLARYASARSVESNIAFVAIVSFAAFMIGPPLVGFVAAKFGLANALIVLAPIGLLSTLLVSFNLIRTERPAT